MRQSVFINLALSAAVTIAMLGGAELWARRSEPPTPGTPSDKRELRWKEDFYTLKPAPADWPPHREFNRDGVRDRAHAPEKPDGVRRLVFLGDSVTLGPDGHPEQAFPQVLQQRLDALGPGFEVFNVSLWGWATPQERTAYREIARAYHPDDVFLGVCLNDIRDLQNSVARPHPLLTTLHERSALVRWAIDARGREIRSIEDLFVRFESPAVRAGLRRLEDEIRALKRDVAADGASLGILLFPFRGQLTAHARAPVVQEHLRHFCTEEGLPFVDLLPVLRPLGEAAFLEGDGIHLSPAGCTRVAEFLAESGPIARAQPGVSASAPWPQVLSGLKSPDANVRRDAAWALGRRGAQAEAVAALRASLGDPEERVRAESAAALGLVGSDRPEVRDDLLRALGDGRQSVRWRAAQALARLGPRTPDEAGRLAEYLASSDPHVTQFAAWALGEMGAAARGASSALTASLHAADLGVRAVAARSLGRIAQGDRAAMDALSASLSDESWPERWRSARALRHFGAGAASHLARGLASRDEVVRLECALALAEIGPEAAAARPALEIAASDENHEVRAAAQKALKKIARR